MKANPVPKRIPRFIQLLVGGVLLVGLILFIGTLYASPGYRPNGSPISSPGYRPNGSPISSPGYRPNGSPISSPTAHVRIDGWKIYVDQRYGYSIQYPEDWYVSPTAEAGYGAVAIFTNYDPATASERVNPVPDAIKVEIVQLTKPAEQSFAAWSTASVQQTLQSSVAQDYGMRLESQAPIVVNETEGLQYLFQYNSPQPPSLLMSIPKDSTKVYEIIVRPANSKHFTTFKTMLASFRFSP